MVLQLADAGPDGRILFVCHVLLQEKLKVFLWVLTVPLM